MADQLGCLFMLTACITTMHDQICLVLCKPHFSLDTWLVYAMASFSCLGQWVSVPHCSLFDTYTGQLSVSSLPCSMSFVIEEESSFGIRRERGKL